MTTVSLSQNLQMPDVDYACNIIQNYSTILNCPLIDYYSKQNLIHNRYIILLQYCTSTCKNKLDNIRVLSNVQFVFCLITRNYQGVTQVTSPLQNQYNTFNIIILFGTGFCEHAMTGKHALTGKERSHKFLNEN